MGIYSVIFSNYIEMLGASTILLEMHVHLLIQAFHQSANHVAEAQCTESCRYKSGALVNTDLKDDLIVFDHGMVLVPEE